MTALRQSEDRQDCAQREHLKQFLGRVTLSTMEAYPNDPSKRIEHDHSGEILHAYRNVSHLHLTRLGMIIQASLHI